MPHDDTSPMADDAEHLAEFVRFVCIANKEVVEGRLDKWAIITTATDDRAFLGLEVIGTKGEHTFAFNPTCTCNLAEVFLHAVRVLNDALSVTNAHAKGSKVTRLRPNGKRRPTH